ncbi:MAG: ImmA/IrrE family metallo-endopeptidase [Calditerrivibrio sp.]|nr:ImmA/IrrE family metallo-endopeptidase [Calditerrivibrio sp.]
MKVEIFNQNILIELKNKYPEKWNKLNFKNKEKWLIKEDYPTYIQLVKISEIFNIPFGYLFLDKLPEKKLPIPYFRTTNNTSYEISDELYDTILQVQKQQEWIKDILLEWGHEPLPFAGIYNINTDIQTVADKITEILKLKNNWAEERINWNEAFKFLVDRFEEAGIFVVINGIVRNNTHRKLDVGEFRGFVLYDNIAPFVFINNNDFVSAKIFTLIHELVHILIGKSASFDLRDMQSANVPEEKFCDRCTAEFLVPSKELMDIKNIEEDTYENLAKKYKVSKIVIARRLLDIGKINKDTFLNFYKNYSNQEIVKSKSQDGNFYNTIQYRYGYKFLEILKYAISNNQILYRDFYCMLSLKAETAEKILKDVI